MITKAAFPPEEGIEKYSLKELNFSFTTFLTTQTIVAVNPAYQAIGTRLRIRAETDEQYRAKASGAGLL